MKKRLEKDLAKRKADLARWKAWHPREYTLPEDVETIRNLAYTPEEDRQHCMDMYRPKDAQGPLPVILQVHGGGLILASKETNRPFCATLAQMGFLVFCAETPLVPDVLIYDQFAAVSAAMDTVADCAAAYGGDPDRIYLVGDNSGALLLTYAVAMQSCPALAEAAGVTPSRLKARAMGLLSGMFYTRKRDTSGIGRLAPAYYGDDWKRHPFLPYTDPERPEITAKLPPCFLLTAKYDYLRAYTRDFYAALQKQGVECELLDVEGELPHDFSVLEPEEPESREANRKMADFLLRH